MPEIIMSFRVVSPMTFSNQFPSLKRTLVALVNWAHIHHGNPEAAPPKMLPETTMDYVGFNPAALFICFRESLEAVITVTVMLQFLQKTLADTEPVLLARLRRHVWAGAVTGLLVAVTVGSGLVLTIWFLKEDILGEAGDVWENAFELFAAILQTYIALKFISYTNNTNSNAMTAKWQRRINHHLVTATATEQLQQQQLHQASESTTPLTFDTSEVAPLARAPFAEEPLVDGLQDAESQTHKSFSKFDYPFAILAFSVVLREGMESVIYLTGISAGESPSAIAIPGLLGIALSICTGILIYKCSARIELRPLMITSVCMMLVLSAALVSEIAGEAEEYMYEAWWGIDDDDIPFLWDLSGCCDEKTVPLFQVLSALIGWKARPTAGSMGAYLLYWAFIVVFVFVKKQSSAAITTTQRDGGAAAGEESVDENTPLLGTA